MIDYKNNHINLVVLGNFNPSILTHDFLVNECGLELGKAPVLQSPPMPVVASLEYNGLTFFADLGRLQITQKDCQKPKSSRLPSYVRTYLDKLSHTPVNKCGANFSYILGVEQSRLEQINAWLRDERKKLCETLQTKVVDVELVSTVGDEEQIKSWALRTKTAEYEAATTLKATLLDSANEVEIDFNYEVAGLDRDRKRLRSVTADFPKVVDLFKDQVEKIFAE